MTNETQTCIIPDPKGCKIPDPVSGRYWTRILKDSNTHAWSRDDGAVWDMTLIFRKFEVGTNKYLGGWLLFEAEEDATPNDEGWAKKYNSALDAFIRHGACFEAWDEETKAPLRNKA